MERFTNSRVSVTVNIGSQVFSNPVTELVSNLIWDNCSAYDIFPIVEYD